MMGCTTCKHCLDITKVNKDLYEVVCEECDDNLALLKEELMLDCDDYELGRNEE